MRIVLLLYFCCFLIPGLERPIKDLKIDEKRFIAQRLNGKGNYGEQMLIHVVHMVLSVL